MYKFLKTLQPGEPGIFYFFQVLVSKYREQKVVPGYETSNTGAKNIAARNHPHRT
jgi:hypothetical protein